MASKTFVLEISRELPVLFVYIGWGSGYDETDEIKGGHRHFKNSTGKMAEANAFVKDEGGKLRCGIDRGAIPYKRAHVVFVARRSPDEPMRVVGIYAAAKFEADGEWSFAVARCGFLINEGNRPAIPSWPAGQGMRRWASLGPRRSHPPLLRFFERVKRDLASGKLSSIRHDAFADQTYADLELTEGQRRTSVVVQRHREARLRRKKIQSALGENDGHLKCEVPGCGFDFFEKYGEIGRGYAHVHHRSQLAKSGKRGSVTRLDDLAILCANCHAMIHVGGECRDMAALIPRL